MGDRARALANCQIARRAGLGRSDIRTLGETAQCADFFTLALNNIAYAAHIRSVAATKKSL